jgi:hypothetical protein
VDTGSEYTWAPATTVEKLGISSEKKDLTFVMANGQQITRSVGFAIVRVDKHFTVDEVVFAEKGDLLLLGARSLEGLNLAVDTQKKSSWPPARCPPRKLRKESFCGEARYRRPNAPARLKSRPAGAGAPPRRSRTR